MAHHRDSGADITVLLANDVTRNDCGSVVLDCQGWISSFEEKVAPGKHSHVNAGVYVISRGLLFGIPPGTTVSIERELFPQWLRDKKLLGAVVSPADCIDIGTPDRYHKAQISLARAELPTLVRH